MKFCQVARTIILIIVLAVPNFVEHRVAPICDAHLFATVWVALVRFSVIRSLVGIVILLGGVYKRIVWVVQGLQEGIVCLRTS
jgi:hypothetical protein